MRLSLCSSCSRHARGTLCPFCGGPLAEPAEPPRVSRRAFTRTAVFTAGAVMAGCGGEDEETVVTDEDQSTGDEEELTLEERQQRDWEERNRQRRDRESGPGGPAMPYGAPPDRPEWV